MGAPEAVRTMLPPRASGGFCFIAAEACLTATKQLRGKRKA